jgi:hypothetical protein
MLEEPRDLGPQPLASLLARHELSPTHLVDASGEQLTHKMVTRAAKGRRLTGNAMGKVLRALNKAAQASYDLPDLFNYKP